MIIVEGQARVRSARFTIEKRAEIEKIVRDSREEKGCLDFTVSIDVLDPCMITIAGKWEDWDSFRAHLAQPYVVDWHSKVRELAIHGHVIQVYEVSGMRPIGKINSESA